MKKAILLFLLFLAAIGAPLSALAEDAGPIAVSEALITATKQQKATVEESPLGNLTADAIRAVCQADIAIVPGGVFAADLQPGDIYPEDVVDLFYEDESIVVSPVTWAKVADMLEAGIARAVVTEAESLDKAASAFDGFPQISGFSFAYEPGDPPGERLYHLYNAVGEEIPETSTEVVTAAMPVSLAAGAYGYPAAEDAAESGYTLAGALETYLSQRGTVGEIVTEGRSREAGVRQNLLEVYFGLDSFTVIFITAAAAAFVVVIRTVLRRTEERPDNEANEF